MHAYANWPEYEVMKCQPFADWPQYTSEWDEAEPAKVVLDEDDFSTAKPYQPGELLTMSAQISPPFRMQTGGQWPQPNSQAHALTADAEVKSECSTADTVEDMAVAMARNQERPFALEGFTALGMPGVPSMGSAGHHLGMCKPCAFVFKGGCTNGVGCVFCHLCAPGEKKRRKKESKDRRRVIQSMR